MRLAGQLAGVALCVAAAACQSGTTAPSPASPAQSGLMPSGRYLLSVSTFSEFSQKPPCTGRLDSWGIFGPQIGGFVVLSAEGDGWSARPASAADGDAELRLMRGGGSGTEVPVSGQLRGIFIDFFDRFLTSPPRSVSLAGKGPDNSATMTGSIYPGLGLIATASGDITFTHTSDTTVTCPEVILTVAGPH